MKEVRDDLAHFGQEKLEVLRCCFLGETGLEDGAKVFRDCRELAGRVFIPVAGRRTDVRNSCRYQMS